MAKVKSIRVRLQAYDHKILDLSVEKIIMTAKKTGANVVGPIPLPTETMAAELHGLRTDSVRKQ